MENREINASEVIDIYQEEVARLSNENIMLKAITRGDQSRIQELEAQIEQMAMEIESLSKPRQVECHEGGAE